MLLADPEHLDGIPEAIDILSPSYVAETVEEEGIRQAILRHPIVRGDVNATPLTSALVVSLIARKCSNAGLELRKTIVHLFRAAVARGHTQMYEIEEIQNEKRRTVLAEPWFRQNEVTDEQVKLCAHALAAGMADETLCGTSRQLLEILLCSDRFYEHFVGEAEDRYDQQHRLLKEKNSGVERKEREHDSWSGTPLALSTNGAVDGSSGMRCHEQWLLLWQILFSHTDPKPVLLRTLNRHAIPWLVFVVRSLRSPDYLPTRCMAAALLKMWQRPPAWWPFLRFVVDSPAVFSSLLRLTLCVTRGIRHDAFQCLRPMLGFPNDRKSPAMRAVINGHHHDIITMLRQCGPESAVSNAAIEATIQSLGEMPLPSEMETIVMNTQIRRMMQR